MAKKLPEKFEDWTPPWSEGEFDEDRAARLVFQLTRDRDSYKEKTAALRAELDTATEERDTLKDKADSSGANETQVQADLTAAKSRIRELEKAAKEGRPEDSDRIARLEVAIEKKLTVSQANRLSGKDKDELLADADAYLEEIGRTDEAEGEEAEQPREPAYLQGSGIEGRISGVRRRGELGNGRGDRRQGGPALTAAQALKDGDELFGEL